MADKLLFKNNWYVLVMRSLTHRNAASLLSRLGFEFYLPLQKQLHYWSDRKKWIDVPILSPYVFVYTNESERNILFQSSQCFRFLTSNGKLATARAEEIEEVKLLCNYGQRLTLTSTHIQVGNKVKIISGPLAGLEGHAMQENGKNKFIIRINSLAQFASVEVETCSLQSC